MKPARYEARGSIRGARHTAAERGLTGEAAVMHVIERLAFDHPTLPAFLVRAAIAAD